MSKAVDSPCVGVCQLNNAGVCVGCLRTMEEIAAWPRLDSRARQAVLDRLDLRAQDVDN